MSTPEHDSGGDLAAWLPDIFDSVINEYRVDTNYSALALRRELDRIDELGGDRQTWQSFHKLHLHKGITRSVAYRHIRNSQGEQAVRTIVNDYWSDRNTDNIESTAYFVLPSYLMNISKYSDTTWRSSLYPNWQRFDELTAPILEECVGNIRVTAGQSYAPGVTKISPLSRDLFELHERKHIVGELLGILAMLDVSTLNLEAYQVN